MEFEKVSCCVTASHHRQLARTFVIFLAIIFMPASDLLALRFLLPLLYGIFSRFDRILRGEFLARCYRLVFH